MRLVDRISAVTQTELEKYVTSERRRIKKLPPEYAEPMLAKLEAKPLLALRTEIAKAERAKLGKANASAATCGAPPLDAKLDRAAIEQLIQQIGDADTDSEREKGSR